MRKIFAFQHERLKLKIVCFFQPNRIWQVFVLPILETMTKRYFWVLFLQILLNYIFGYSIVKMSLYDFPQRPPKKNAKKQPSTNQKKKGKQKVSWKIVKRWIDLSFFWDSVWLLTLWWKKTRFLISVVWVRQKTCCFTIGIRFGWKKTYTIPNHVTIYSKVPPPSRFRFQISL